MYNSSPFFVMIVYVYGRVTKAPDFFHDRTPLTFISFFQRKHKPSLYCRNHICTSFLCEYMIYKLIIYHIFTKPSSISLSLHIHGCTLFPHKKGGKAQLSLAALLYYLSSLFFRIVAIAALHIMEGNLAAHGGFSLQAIQNRHRHGTGHGHIGREPVAACAVHQALYCDKEHHLAEPIAFTHVDVGLDPTIAQRQSCGTGDIPARRDWWRGDDRWDTAAVICPLGIDCFVGGEHRARCDLRTVACGSNPAIKSIASSGRYGQACQLAVCAGCCRCW